MTGPAAWWRQLPPDTRWTATLGALATTIALVAAVLVTTGGDEPADLSVTPRPPTSTSVSASPESTTSTAAPLDTPSTDAPSTTGRPATTRGPVATAPTTTSPNSMPAAPLPRVTLRRIASLEQPLALATRAGDAALYIAEKRGRVRAYRNGTVDPTPVLDITAQVSTGSEQGLLGIAFAPGRPLLFAHFTDTDGNTRVVEYDVSSGRAAMPGRVILTATQPFANHNGGHLAFGPDGRLYIGLGDGGSGGDPHGNGQNLNSVLGKILRIDPFAGGGQPYAIPSDNPFAGRSGARGEVWSYGLRNPWRFSFDRSTGEIWIADVGQGSWEEINRGPGAGRGANYGWNLREGTRAYNNGARPPGNVDPVIDYSHEGGNCSVTGGYVYRGNRIPGLRGAFLYGDYCAGEVRAVVNAGGGRSGTTGLGAKAEQLASFGEDEDGELYVLSLSGPVYRVDPA